MSLRQRLYLQFTLAILPLLALAVYQAFTRSDLPERVNEALVAYDLSLDATNAFRKFMDGIADAVDTGRVGGNTIDAAGASAKAMRKLADRYPEDADTAQRLESVVGAIPSNATVESLMPLNKELQALRQAIAQSTERRRQALSALVAEEEKSQKKRRDLLLAGGVAALAILVFTAWFLRRLVVGITDPITRSVTAANAIAEGRLDGSIDMKGIRHGEMEQLLGAMTAMQGNLTQLVVSVRDRAQSVSAASKLLTSETTALSRRSEEQASSLAQAAASMEELSSTVRGNTENAKRANDLARRAAQAGTTGTGAVERVAQTMDQITQSSRKIADIVGLIDSIAFQTNILALNAAVEAARAGDQGRGFAVVAAEVRSLSQRCAGAATEIRGLIEASTRHVEDGAKRVDEAGHSISALVEDVKQVSALMGDIAGASAEQERGIAQVATSVTQMDGVVHRNAAAAHESANTAERLEHDAFELQQAASRFVTADGQDTRVTPIEAVESAPRVPALSRPR